MMHIENTFRPNTQGDVSMITQNPNDYTTNPKRGRCDFDHTTNERSKYDRFDRDRSDQLKQVKSILL